MYQKIMVPIDGSAPSISVLPLICSLLGQHEADIILLRVIEYPSSLYPMCYEYPSHDPRAMEVVNKKKKIICQKVKNYLRQVASTIESDVISVSTEACEGPVVEAILEATDRLGIDLIAMAAYGETGSIPGMIGSVADRVLHEAHVPVMLFRPAHTSERENMPLLTLA